MTKKSYVVCRYQLRVLSHSTALRKLWLLIQILTWLMIVEAAHFTRKEHRKCMFPNLAFSQGKLCSNLNIDNCPAHHTYVMLRTLLSWDCLSFYTVLNGEKFLYQTCFDLNCFVLKHNLRYTTFYWTNWMVQVLFDVLMCTSFLISIHVSLISTWFRI